jgi:hypothetical protein
MTKQIPLPPRGNSAGAIVINPPRASDTIGNALRSAFQHQGTPDDLLMILKGLDHIEAIPTRN